MNNSTTQQSGLLAATCHRLLTGYGSLDWYVNCGTVKTELDGLLMTEAVRMHCHLLASQDITGEDADIG